MDSNFYSPRHSLHKGTFINDGWFPDLDLEPVQKRYRLDASISIEALFESVMQAVLLVNENLKAFACEKHRAGYESLAALPSAAYQFQGLGEDPDPENAESKSHYVKLYENAVFYRVKGDLTRENSHHTMLEEGKKRQNDYHSQSNDFYRQSILAVRMIKGRKPTRARLL